MAKSLEELELAFQAQYPKVEKKRRFKKQSPVDRQVEAIQKETTKAIRPEDIARRTVVEEPNRTSKEELEEMLEAASTTSPGSAKADKRITFSAMDIVFYGVLALMIVGAIIFSREVLGNQSIGGKSFYEVKTTSMQGTYPKGSLVFVKDIDPNVLEKGDDIAFIDEENEIIISRITEIREELDENDNQVFVTSGVNELDSDSKEVVANKVIGKVTSGIPIAGAVLNWIGSNLLLVFVILGLLIAVLVYVKLFRHQDRNPKKD